MRCTRNMKDTLQRDDIIYQNVSVIKVYKKHYCLKRALECKGAMYHILPLQCEVMLLFCTCRIYILFPAKCRLWVKSECKEASHYIHLKKHTHRHLYYLHNIWHCCGLAINKKQAALQISAHSSAYLESPCIQNQPSSSGMNFPVKVMHANTSRQ